MFIDYLLKKEPFNFKNKIKNGKQNHGNELKKELFK